jgi:phosphoribosylformylglycinamidine (FGAM) synthase PurS component
MAKVMHIKAHTGFAGCVHEGEIELEGDESEEELEELAKEFLFNRVEYSYTVEEK